MRIISKYKDYYDHLSKIYGVDDKVILDRRKNKQLLLLHPRKLTLILCGIKYEGVFDGKNFYWGKDLWNISITDKKPNRKFSLLGYNPAEYAYISVDEKTDMYPYNINHKFRVSTLPVVGYEKVNKQYDCPILISEDDTRFVNDMKFNKFQKLENIEFPMPPKQIYLMLSEWLSPKDITTNNQSNTEKILSHGFDTKTSFRKTKV